MKYVLTTLATGLVVWSGLATIAAASVQSGDFIKLSDGPGGPGGIFYASEVPADPSSNFPTFCVQLTEFISLGTTYQAVLNDVTVTGGVPLSSKAAWLYTMFLHQSSQLTGFDFSRISPAFNGNILARDQANAVQLGIWLNMLPASVVGDVAKANYVSARAGALWTIAYINTLKTTYLNSWLDNYDDSRWADTDFKGNIKIMNLYGKDSSGNYTLNQQDQLVEHMPEPGAVVVWAGLTGVGLAVARRRNVLRRKIG